MRAQAVWLPTSHYEKIFSPQYLPYRVKYNWWLVVPTTVFLYWFIVVKVWSHLNCQRKYFVDESKVPEKRKYYSLEPSYYNAISRRLFTRNLNKQHANATYIV